MAPTVDLDTILAALNIQPHEHISMMFKHANGKQRIIIAQADQAQQKFAELDGDESQTTHAWFVPNPTTLPLSDKSFQRGEEAQVSRVTAFTADLDVKPGACPSIEIARQIAEKVSETLDWWPVAAVYSGGGYQPIWAINTDNDADARALTRRFHRHIGAIAADIGHAVDGNAIKVDTTHDLCRNIRIPLTFNAKYTPPRQVEAELLDGGTTITAAELTERLDTLGVPVEDSDSTPLGAVVSSPSEWDYAPASTECRWAKATLDGIAADAPTDRHNGFLLAKTVKVEAMRRAGLLTHTEYRAAKQTVERRFDWLLANTGTPRARTKREVENAWSNAESVVARKTDAQLVAELNGHQHIDGQCVSSTTGFYGYGKKEPKMYADMLGGNETREDKPLNPAREITQTVTGLENGFWESRESLHTIYRAALSRMASPWAVLGACAARVLTRVPTSYTLPDLTGGKGSLNWFCVLATRSGGGKGAAMSIAAELVPGIWNSNVGSGEGLIDQYFSATADESNPEGRRQAVLFEVDEISSLAANLSRNGSTLDSVVKTGFMGQLLHFAYKARNGRLPRRLEPHDYRMTMIVAAQPERADVLFNDGGGGLPQRVFWFCATDARATRQARIDAQMPHLYPLQLPNLMYSRDIQIPAEAEDFIFEQKELINDGLLDDLATHATFAREKLAYALAVMDGRLDINLEDWELSGVAAAVSDATRDWVARQMMKGKQRQAREAGQLQGHRNAAAEETKTAVALERNERLAAWLLAKIGDAGGSMTKREVTMAVASRDRAVLPAVIAQLVTDGLLVESRSERGGVSWSLAPTEKE